MSGGRVAAVLIGGTVFGAGLALSTMTQQEVVLAFLHLDDLGLLLVMGGGMAVAAAAFHLGPGLWSRPIRASDYEPVKDVLDWRTVAGAALFGVGWGISGLCPGSALASLGTGNLPVLAGLAGMFVGAALKAVLFDRPRRP